MRLRQTVLLLLTACLVVGGAGVAAAKKKTKAKAREKAAPKANTRAVAELMGPFTWGMSPAKVLTTLGKEIDERYKARIAATRDIYTQDRLRKDAVEERARIKKTFTKFSGKKTGWDVSLIDREFAQKNDESMLVYWETDQEEGKDQRRFFFFVDDKLWKMYIAFNAERFEGKTFQDFKGIMESRYGKGKVELVDDVPVVEWRSDKHYLRAIDMTKFYGNFCLAISDNATEAWIGGRRKERNPDHTVETSLIESITSDGGNTADLKHENENVVDGLMGDGKNKKK